MAVYRYLISGDAHGDILIWRIDRDGWFQLLRKLKKDIPAGFKANSVNLDESPFGVGCVLSLTMHPERSRGQLLVLSRIPATVRVINLNTYKQHSSCAGFGGMTTPAAAGNVSAGAPFARATISADGNYVVAGSNYQPSGGGFYKIGVWEFQSGAVVRSAISDLMFSQPVRSISWHPTQHLFAAAMVI
jgi:hypothetical protein